jgi:hypothetical protein
MNPENERYENLPDAIIERLRARDSKVSMLTPAVDRAVNDAARQQFAPRRPRAAVRRFTVPLTAAAAAALVAILIVRPFDAPVDEEAMRLADDVDGSGQVDILDAFALARSRRDDAGIASQDRIDELAERIVSLSSTEAVL